MSKVAKRCYETHPPLPIGNGLVVYGGSCAHPIVTSADVYVGLDMTMRKTSMRFPWEDGDEILFPIPDMRVPSDPAQFKKLLEWLAVQLAAKRKVHVGCIGGHGRTGLVLSALVNVITGEKDAISYVRESYCKKAVESVEQIDFLEKHFGIARANPTKELYLPMRGGQYDHANEGSGVRWWEGAGYVKHGTTGKNPKKSKPAPLVELIKVTETPGSIWGGSVSL